MKRGLRNAVFQRCLAHTGSPSDWEVRRERHEPWRNESSLWPTGDGRTVVNTRTGEIRVTATGESVEDFNARRARENEARQAQLREEEERRVESAFRKEQARRADQQALAFENGFHFHAIQMAV